MAQCRADDAQEVKGLLNAGALPGIGARYRPPENGSRVEYEQQEAILGVVRGAARDQT